MVFVYICLSFCFFGKCVYISLITMLYFLLLINLYYNVLWLNIVFICLTYFRILFIQLRFRWLCFVIFLLTILLSEIVMHFWDLCILILFGFFFSVNFSSPLCFSLFLLIGFYLGNLFVCLSKATIDLGNL